jgi:hypothetical protein
MTTTTAPTSAELASLIAYLTKQRTEALAICLATDLAFESAPVESAEHAAALHAARAADDSFYAAHDALLVARWAVAALAAL